MILEIITPEKQVFTGEVTSVKFPGTSGEFEVQNNHAPIISTLTSGVIRVITSGKDPENFEINGGVIEVLNNNVI